MKATERIEFDAAHRIPGRTLHGHRFTVDVSIVGDVRSDGMVIDPLKVRLVLASFVGRFDQRTLLHFQDPLFLFLTDDDARETFNRSEGRLNVDAVAGADEWGIDGMLFIPTVENMAQYFANILADQDIGVYDVTVRESGATGAVAEPQPKCSECGSRGTHPASCSRRHE